MKPNQIFCGLTLVAILATPALGQSDGLRDATKQVTTRADARVSVESAPVKRADEIERLKDRIETLEAMLAESQRQRKDASARLAELEKAGNGMFGEDGRRREEYRLRAAIRNEELFVNLLIELLESTKPEVQRKGLLYIFESYSVTHGVGMGQLLAVYPRVTVLAQSADASVAKEASRALVLLSPKKAAIFGFQPKPAGVWFSVDDYMYKQFSVRRELMKPTTLSYKDIKLSKILEDLRENHVYVEFNCSPTVDQDQLVTFELRNQSLGLTLDRLIRHLGYVHKVEEGIISITEKTDPERFAVLTYNVRGLFSDQQGIDELQKLAEQLLLEGETVTLVGKYQLVVSAVESTHRKISRVFGNLTSE